MEVLEMLSWFKWREAVLRNLVSERDPIPVFKPTMRIGDFYIDICVDRAKFKLKASRWDEVMQETERVTLLIGCAICGRQTCLFVLRSLIRGQHI